MIKNLQYKKLRKKKVWEMPVFWGQNDLRLLAEPIIASLSLVSW